MEIFKVLLPELNIWDNNRYYNYWSKKDDSVEPEVKQTYLVSAVNKYFIMLKTRYFVIFMLKMRLL